MKYHNTGCVSTKSSEDCLFYSLEYKKMLVLKTFNKTVDL